MGTPSPRRTLLAPGNEAAWAEINEQDALEQRRRAREATVEERIERGLELSRLAHDIRTAVRTAGDGRRA
jgi:hypothetical protein